MSEVIKNTNTSYLDIVGLKKYDELIKGFIAKGNGTLVDAINALDAKIGTLNFEGLDGKNLTEIVEGIYASIAELIAKDESLDAKDVELEGKINDIVGDLESLEESNALMTLVEVSNKLKAIEDSVSKNAQDITNVTTRVTAVEEAVAKLGEIEGGESLGTIVSIVYQNQDAISTLNGDVADAKSDAASAVSTADEAKGIAESASTVAGEAKADAAQAKADAESAAASAASADSSAQASAASAASAATVAGEAKSAAEGAVATAGEASTTAGEAKNLAEQAQSDAAQAKADAATAVSDASTAKSDAATAVSDASTAKSDAAAAVETANTASATAGTAQTTANEAAATAGTAATVAGEAKDAAEGAVSVADEAKGIADNAAVVAGEANAAANANATAIGKLDERIADLEGISNVAEVKYEDGFIKLYDKDGNAIGDGFSAADFVVDGMLESVAFKEVDGVKTNVLVFTFNTDHGSDAVEIDFSKYVDVYHADETSLTLNSDSKTFSVKEVAANKTKLGQKITIAGGPLANNIAESGEVWPSKWTNGTEKFIPEDATMYDIVMNLFCVEKWPVKSNGSSNVSTSDASLVSKMDTPTLTYNGKTVNGNSTTVEVGTTVSYDAKSGKSSYTATPHKASGFTYGYADANDDVKDSSNTEKSASFGTISPVSDSVPTLTLSGKVSETIEGTAATATAGTASKSGSVVIALGDNKIKAQGKSITYTGTCTELPVYYGCSNLGNTNNDGTTYHSTEKGEVTLTSTAVSSGSIEINCVGAYKVFVGYTAEVPTTSAGVRAMNKNNRLGKGSCGTADTVYTIDNNYMVVAVPTGWDFTIQNDLGQADQRNSFAKSDNTVAVELPNHTEEVPSTVSYDIWSIGWSGGAYKNLIIK
jgi:hypothetical protein